MLPQIKAARDEATRQANAAAAELKAARAEVEREVERVREEASAESNEARCLLFLRLCASLRRYPCRQVRTVLWRDTRAAVKQGVDGPLAANGAQHLFELRTVAAVSPILHDSTQLGASLRFAGVRLRRSSTARLRRGSSWPRRKMRPQRQQLTPSRSWSSCGHRMPLSWSSRTFSMRPS